MQDNWCGDNMPACAGMCYRQSSSLIHYINQVIRNILVFNYIKTGVVKYPVTMLLNLETSFTGYSYV